MNLFSLFFDILLNDELIMKTSVSRSPIEHVNVNYFLLEVLLAIPVYISSSP